MINLPAGTKIWLVTGITDMCNGFNGLAAKVQFQYRLMNEMTLWQRDTTIEE